MSYSLTRASTWNIAGYVYLIAASFVSTPILLHSLTLPIFAQYSLIIATLALASSIDLGLPQAVVRALVRARSTTASSQSIWASSSLLFISSGVISATVTAGVAYFLGLPRVISLLIAGLIVMQNLTSHYATLPQSLGHFGYYNSKTFIVGTANTIVAAYLARSGFGIEMILSAQLLSYALTLIPLVHFSLKFFPRPWEYRASRKVCRDLISFGLRNQIGKLVGQLQSQYSKYLLSFVSPIALSGYTIAQGLIQKSVGIISQLATALYPRTADSSNLGRLRAIYNQLQISLIGLGLVGVLLYYLFGSTFLTWWLGTPELVTLCTNVLNVLVWYFLLLIPTPMASTILDGRGKPELTSFFATMTTVLEIAFSLALFTRFSYMAPVYGATAAVILTTPFILYKASSMLQSNS